MPEFRLDPIFTPAADQPKAIDGISESVSAGERFTTLLGATGTGKTMTMAGVIERVHDRREPDFVGDWVVQV